jgi:hypothetical protein
MKALSRTLRTASLWSTAWSMMIAGLAGAQSGSPPSLTLRVEDSTERKYSVAQTDDLVTLSAAGRLVIETATNIMPTSPTAGGSAQLQFRVPAGKSLQYTVSPVANISSAYRLVIFFIDSGAATDGTTMSSVTADASQQPPATAQAIAASAAANEDAKSLRTFQTDMPLNTPPAFVVLGIAPGDIPRASSAREFVGQIARGVDASGKIKTGLAGEISLYKLLSSEKSLPLGQYRDDPAKRLLANTTVSFATPTESGGSSGAFALGLQTTWIDQLDPATTNLPDCFKRIAQATFERLRGRDTVVIGSGGVAEAVKLSAEDQATIKTSLDKAVPLCFKDYAPTSGFRFGTGIGQAYSADGGAASALKKASTVYWATGSYTLGNLTTGDDGTLLPNRRAEAFTHIRWHKNQQTAAPSGTGTVLTDSRVLAAKLRFSNTAQTFSGLVEASRHRNSIFGFADENVTRRVFGIEVRIAKDTWFFVGSGGERGRRDGKDSRFGLANLKFGSASAAQFQP